MIEPLTDQGFEGLKEYYKTCTEPKPDVFSLIATVERLKVEHNHLKAELGDYLQWHKEDKEEVIFLESKNLLQFAVIEKIKMQLDAAIKRIEEMEVK